jgi:hypothetical protein
VLDYLKELEGLRFKLNNIISGFYGFKWYK